MRINSMMLIGVGLIIALFAAGWVVQPPTSVHAQVEELSLQPKESEKRESLKIEGWDWRAVLWLEPAALCVIWENEGIWCWEYGSKEMQEEELQP